MPLVVRLLIFLVALGGSATFWVAIVNHTHAYGWNRKAVHVLTMICALALVFSLWPLALFAFDETSPSAASILPAWLVQGWGWGSLAIAAVALTHNLWRWRHPERRGGIGSQRSTPLDMNVANPADLLAPGVPRRLGTLPLNEVVSPVRVETDLLVPKLPSAFDGLRIAHLSDLHMSGRLARGYYDAIVDGVNLWQPEVVVITGDIVENSTCHEWIDQTLARLEASESRLFVLGNHDHKADADETRRRLVACGFEDAGGRALQMATSRGACLVAGNETPWFCPAPEVTPATDANDTLRLALMHTPDHFAWAQQNSFHVALAGHNHGGQIRFPLLGALLAPSVHGTRYACGVFTSSTTVMHVTPGTGSLAPLRYNCPPELNLLTLRPILG